MKIFSVTIYSSNYNVKFIYSHQYSIFSILDIES